MPHPFVHARITPQKPAVILAESGTTLTFGELENGANQDAHLLRRFSLVRGDCVAAMLANGFDILRLAWAAERSGLYFCAIATHLTTDEAAYIVKDSGSRVFFADAGSETIAADIAAQQPGVSFLSAGPEFREGHDWGASSRECPETPIEDESAGTLMLYSSGTTGRPKGIKRDLPVDGLLAAPPVMSLFTGPYGATKDSVYLCPAPLYHAAPLVWTMLAHRLGCTVVVMEKFDAEAVLHAIEAYRVTHAQFVPTHFVRMLKLPEETRARYDLSSLVAVWHAAAPCPVPVKQAMLDWLGPIVHEYYSGTEGVGFTAIGPAEWLERPGSVGKALGCRIHACDDDDNSLPARTEGRIFFEGGRSFAYHNDPDKTAGSRNKHGWTTLGDVGWIDEDGFLFLTDRANFMIISGGVNVYPQEIENLMVTHPDVYDVAVVGLPDPEMGERVVAVVQLVDPASAGPGMAERLADWLKSRLSGVKRPREIRFVSELPRQANGKLYKRQLQQQLVTIA